MTGGNAVLFSGLPLRRAGSVDFRVQRVDGGAAVRLTDGLVAKEARSLRSR